MVPLFCPTCQTLFGIDEIQSGAAISTLHGVVFDIFVGHAASAGWVKQLVRRSSISEGGSDTHQSRRKGDGALDAPLLVPVARGMTLAESVRLMGARRLQAHPA